MTAAYPQLFGWHVLRVVAFCGAAVGSLVTMVGFRMEAVERARRRVATTNNINNNNNDNHDNSNNMDDESRENLLRYNHVIAAGECAFGFFSLCSSSLEMLAAAAPPLCAQ